MLLRFFSNRQVYDFVLLLQAPLGCAQWYNMNSGTITSLNLQNGQYLKNLR
jgi:hypothetical protein